MLFEREELRACGFEVDGDAVAGELRCCEGWVCGGGEEGGFEAGEEAVEGEGEGGVHCLLWIVGVVRGCRCE